MSAFDIGEPRGLDSHPNSPNYDDSLDVYRTEVVERIKAELRGNADECLTLLAEAMIDSRLMLSLMAGDHAEFGRLCAKILTEEIAKEADRRADDRIQEEVDEANASYGDYLANARAEDGP